VQSQLQIPYHPCSCPTITHIAHSLPLPSLSSTAPFFYSFFSFSVIFTKKKKKKKKKVREREHRRQRKEEEARRRKEEVQDRGGRGTTAVSLCFTQMAK
jgi:hypothetical protein